MIAGAKTVAQALLIDLPCHRRDDGEVVVAEGLMQVPFAIARMFTVRAPAGAVRGQHAHRRCSQVVLCVSGAVAFSVSDLTSTHTFTLDRGDRALFVPPMLWQSVAFIAPQSVLIGLCDRPYEEDDYIRDHAAFVEARGGVL